MDIETSRGSAKFQTANVIVLKQEIDELKAKMEKKQLEIAIQLANEEENKFKKIQELVAFDYVLARNIKKIIESEE